MEVTEQELKDRYESLETDELVVLYTTTDLTNLAASILKDILITRGVGEKELQAWIVKEDADITKVPCKPVSTPLPRLWVGYVIAAAFLVYGIGEYMLDPSSADRVSPGLVIIYFIGLVFWLFCVYRIHWILAEATNNRYPITPGKGAGFHLIPLFNLYWFFKWPNEVASFLNSQSDTKIMQKGLPGFFLLVGFLFVRLDASIALLIMFTVTIYIAKKIRHVVRFRQSDSKSA